MVAFDLRRRDLITTREWSREEPDFALNAAEYFEAAYYASKVPKILKEVVNCEYGRSNIIYAKQTEDRLYVQMAALALTMAAVGEVL